MVGYANEYTKNEEVVAEVIRLFDSKYKETMNTFELLIIVAYK